MKRGHGIEKTNCDTEEGRHDEPAPLFELDGFNNFAQYFECQFGSHFDAFFKSNICSALFDRGFSGDFQFRFATFDLECSIGDIDRSYFGILDFLRLSFARLLGVD